MFVKIKRLPELGDLPLPKYGKDGDAARDLYSTINLVLKPGDVAKIPTGIALDLGIGVEAQVRPRSGLSLNGILVHFGTVDPNFRGCLCVIIQNLSREDFVIERGNRIAQLFIGSVTHYEWEEVNELSETSRAENGFGHTGR